MNPCFRICCNTICSSCSLFHSFEVRKPIHLLRSKSPLIPVRKDLDARKFTPSKETEFERKSFLFSTRRDFTLAEKKPNSPNSTRYPSPRYSNVSFCNSERIPSIIPSLKPVLWATVRIRRSAVIVPLYTMSAYIVSLSPSFVVRDGFFFKL